MQDKYNQSGNNRTILSVLAHGSILFGSTVITISVPIAILVISEDAIVKENAKEALNFFINYYILGRVCLILMFLIIGFPLLFLLLITGWVMPIIAIVNILNKPNRSYRCPLILRIL